MSDPTAAAQHLPPATTRRRRRAGTHSYGCVVGGGTVTYGGSSWRHLPYEFNELTHDPTIPSGTGMADWPITYEELEPYYVQAEWEMGISGLRVNSPFVAPMSKDYPVPPVPLKSSGALVQRRREEAGSDGRARPARDHHAPLHGARGVRELRHLLGLRVPRPGPIELGRHVLPLAQKTGKCEIRANSYVREISVDNTGASPASCTSTARSAKSSSGPRPSSCRRTAPESARLLLLSKSPKFPDGLANTNGIVGKYLMLGNGAGASGLFEHPLNEYKGVISGAGIVDYVPSDPKRGFYGGGRLTARGYETPLGMGLNGLSPDAPRWGAGYKKALREEANHKMTITCFATQMPLETNRVDLDPDVKDEWGLPAMRITSTSHPDDIKCMKFFQAEVDRDSEGRGRDEGVVEPARRQPRRRAQPRQLPDGERPEDVGGRQVPPRARRAEPVRHRRQQPRHRRPQPSDDDDSGAGVSGGGAPDQGGEERAFSSRRRRR